MLTLEYATLAALGRKRKKVKKVAEAIAPAAAAKFLPGAPALGPEAALAPEVPSEVPSGAFVTQEAGSNIWLWVGGGVAIAGVLGVAGFMLLRRRR